MFAMDVSSWEGGAAPGGTTQAPTSATVLFPRAAVLSAGDLCYVFATSRQQVEDMVMFFDPHASPLLLRELRRVDISPDEEYVSLRRVVDPSRPPLPDYQAFTPTPAGGGDGSARSGGGRDAAGAGGLGGARAGGGAGGAPQARNGHGGLVATSSAGALPTSDRMARNGMTPTMSLPVLAAVARGVSLVVCGATCGGSSV